MDLRKDEYYIVRSTVKTNTYICFLCLNSKHFNCCSEAGHPHVNVTLVKLPRSERLRTICCVKADCTSLSCLRAAFTYLANFSKTQGGENTVC